MKSTFLLLFICQVSFAFGQSDPQITDIPNRQTTGLNGKWKIIIDPYEIGFFDYRYEENPWGFFQNQKPADKMDRVEYDFDTSDSLNVPGDWNSQRKELLYYEGTVWYKKSFDYKLKPGHRLFLWLGAVNYKSYLYLNGKRLGSHEGGFTPFNFEITNIVKEKDNFLVVKVDNKRIREGVPTLNTDWWNYGGITRDVELVEVVADFISDFSIHLKNGTTNVVEGWVKPDKKLSGRQIKVVIPELAISSDFSTDSSGKASFSLKCFPELWNPENPKLYTVTFIYNKDTLKDKIGFRSIETKGGELLLNGKPVYLRGICMHEEIPMRKARANGSADAKLLLGWAKELNCNFIRLAHYPHNEYVTRMADSLGLMMWSEVPVYWTIQWENQGTYNNAKQQLTENITRDKNRASIIIWSIGNETPVTESRLKFMQNMAFAARQYDKTRLISAALEVHRDPKNGTIYWVDDPLGEYLDVIACNEYIGWYDGLPMKCNEITWKTKYDKPFLFSELGAEAPYGNHGDSLTRWSEEYQEYFYTQQIKMLKKIPFLRGTTPWILADFRSPRRLLPGIQDGWNKKGLISEQGMKKKAFFILRDWYKEIEKKGK
jgi:beta-glucuronidase